MKKYSPTSYIILDVDCNSTEDVSPLAKHFGDKVFLLFNDKVESEFHLRFQAALFEEKDNSPEIQSQYILNLVESLPENLRSLWDQSKYKQFDFGFRSGLEPQPLYVDLSQETLKRIAAIGASIGIWVYPPEEEAPNHAIKADEN